MTGKDLLTAMSGIDGRYIEEAAPAAAPKTRSLSLIHISEPTRH